MQRLYAELANGEIEQLQVTFATPSNFTSSFNVLGEVSGRGRENHFLLLCSYITSEHSSCMIITPSLKKLLIVAGALAACLPVWVFGVLPKVAYVIQ